MFLLFALAFIIVVPTAWAVMHERGLIQKAGETQTQAFWGYHELAAQNSVVRFQRDSGAGRPYIYATDGTEIMEYSDWGDSSWIYVETNGVSRGTEMLYLHPHSYSVNDKLIAHTMRGETWELTQNITIVGPRQVKIDYYFISRVEGVNEVQLSLSHYHWYYSNVQRSNTGFTAKVGENVDRDDIARGVVNPPKFDIQMTTDTPQFLSKEDPVSVGFSDSNGVSNLVTHYQTTGIQRDMVTLIASEIVSWNPVN